MADRDVQIDLLGPFVVRVGGREVSISGFKPRALLATLALDPGRTVSMDRLGDVLWGDAPASRAVVHTYVRRLRSALGPDIITTASGGYRLDLARERIDLHRFRELARCPEDLPATERRQRLAAAVELWRGPPLADLHCDYLERDVAPEIIEELLRAVERRVDAEWEAGEPADLVPELQRLTARHPMRESLWLRLLVTLRRQNRTAEALQAYETIRARLANELGTDPSAALQRIYQELLSGESAPIEAALPMPRQLPLDVHRFLGRGAELEQLDRLFGDPHDEGTVVATITGPAGVGKTALAVRWAHRAERLFPDGQLYVDLRGFGPGDPIGAEVTLEMFLQALNIPAAAIPPDPQARAALLRSSLSGRRVLLVLDNARDEEQVRPLLPGTGGRVLITSRNRLPGLTARDDAVRIDLGGLDTAQAVDLLGRDSADPDTARTLVALCGHLPVPLRVIGERLAHDGRSLTEVLEELRDIGLDAFPDQDRA
ncbi:MAG TPA: BTAD domain-containing putative transcriptional regulator, partial [Mycobacteriales bacterium]|nr:BTAD domain-containing putative transcriptional regulator [Mycobacteriales bacterium]